MMNHIIANTCCNYPNVRYRKISNSRNDLDGHLSLSEITLSMDDMHIRFLITDPVKPSNVSGTVSEIYMFVK